MSGTTTTGSIDGRLRLDISDFLAKIEVVKQEARSLANTDPTITVDADTGRAQASMAAVDAAAAAMGQTAATAGQRVQRSANDVAAAQAKVAAANAAADLAYRKAEIAQMRLTEAQERGKTKASALAAAELALAEALKRLDSANEKATASELALAEAQKNAASAAVKQAVAEEGAAKATDNVGNSAGRASARTQLIIAAVVGLTAVAAPLTGALVGIAGGLAGLGAAGVLGIVGVVQAIKSGSQAGQEWSAGLQRLKADMTQLAGTSAAGMLGSFQRAVALINRNMPQLNSEIAGFSRVLGSTALSALTGVITAFHVLNPLFMQGAGVIQDIADGFSAWASNGGLQQFADYAMSVLPQVIGTIGDLAGAILHIAEATAPIGAAVLGVLDGIATAINAIPVAALTVLAGAAMTGYTAFMMWKGVTAVISGVTAAAETLGITVSQLTWRAGAVGVAIGALAAVFAAVAASNAEAEARAKSYADTLDTVTGKTTDATRAMVVNELAAKTAFGGPSALDAASKLGISAKTLTDAVLGNRAALSTVRAEIDRHKDSLGRLRGAHTESGDAAKILSAAIGTQGGALAEGARLAQQKADAMSTGAAAEEDAAAAAQVAADAFWDQASAAGEAISKLNGLIDVMNTMNGVQQSAEQANARWQKDLAGIGEDAQKQADAYERANGSLEGFSLSLDRNTAAGSANRAMLSGVAGGAQAAAKATYAAEVRTVGADAATRNYAATLADQKQKFIDSALAAGYNAGEVQTLADATFRLPTKTELMFLTNAAEITDEARNLAQEILGLPGGTVTIDEGQLPGVAAALADLGIDITTLPEGNVRVRKDDGTFMTVEEALNLIVRQRNAPVTASANTSSAEAAINDAARNRTSTITVNVQYNHLGGYVQGDGGKSTSYAYGGTVGMAYGGSVPGAAYGVTGRGGTVRGNGSAWSDTAGLYRLAMGEEVTSNTVGQADRWRGMLKAINRNDPAGVIAGKAMQAAGMQAPAAAPVTVSPPSVQVFIGNEEVTGRVRVVVKDEMQRETRRAQMGVR